MRPTHHTFSTNFMLSVSSVVKFKGDCLQVKAKSGNLSNWREAVFLYSAVWAAPLGQAGVVLGSFHLWRSQDEVSTRTSFFLIIKLHTRLRR